MSFSLSDLFFVLVIFQLVFISVFLFTNKKGKKLSNGLLGSFFLVIGLNLIDNFLLLKNYYFSYPSLALWSLWIILLLGPLIYLYTQSILYKDFIMTSRRWIHFVPFLILFLATEFLYNIQPRAVELSILHDVISQKIPSYAFLGPALVFLQFYLYVAASQRLIRQFKKMGHDQYADQQRANISWLSSTINFFIICMIVTTLNGLIGLTPLSKYFYLVFTLVILGLFIFINRVLLKALQKPELFALMSEPGPPNENTPTKYVGSVLTDTESKTILERLQLYMKVEKPYLEAELTLDQLAEQIGVRPKILSQVINELLKQNFFDFINRYRIEEAKRLLTNPEDKKITILEVLYEVGFNSKSSFNTLFKKHTGLTPSEFKQKNSSS